MPACVTLTGCPATVTVVLRDEVEGFAVNVKPTVPLPLPEPPDATVIHASFSVTVQAQPAGAVTLTLPAPPSEAGVSALGDAE